MLVLRLSVMDSVRNQLDTYNGDAPYHFDTFVAFCHLHPAAFFPVYDSQEVLQKRLYGLQYWLDRTAWREEQPARFTTVIELKHMCQFQGAGESKIVTPSTKVIAAPPPKPTIENGGIMLPDERKPKMRMHVHAKVVPGGAEGSSLLENSHFVIPGDVGHHHVQASFISVSTIDAQRSKCDGMHQSQI